MTNRLQVRTDALFDLLEQRWQRMKTQRRLASALVAVFIAGLALVEARRLPWLSQDLIERLPSNHFEAILLPFTLLLLAEVISLVFALAQTPTERNNVSAMVTFSDIDVFIVCFLLNPRSGCLQEDMPDEMRPRIHPASESHRARLLSGWRIP